MEILIIALIKIVLVLLIILTTVANLVYAERKISAAMMPRAEYIPPAAMSAICRMSDWEASLG